MYPRPSPVIADRFESTIRASVRFALRNDVFVNVAPDRSAPVRFAPPKFVFVRLNPERFQPRRSLPLRFAPAATAVPVAMYPFAAIEVPQELVAVTVAVCEVPLVSPVNCELVVLELSERHVVSRHTVYPVIALPPVAVAPLHATVTVVFPTVMTTGAGATGAEMGVIDVVPADEAPAALFATTVGE